MEIETKKKRKTERGKRLKNISLEKTTKKKRKDANELKKNHDFSFVNILMSAIQYLRAQFHCFSTLTLYFHWLVKKCRQKSYKNQKMLQSIQTDSSRADVKRDSVLARLDQEKLSVKIGSKS